MIKNSLGLVLAVIVLSSAPVSAQAPDEIIIDQPTGTQSRSNPSARRQLLSIERPIKMPSQILDELLDETWGNSKREKRAKSVRGLKAFSIDLNSDGRPEIRIYGTGSDFCGATGNCPEWIYRKVGRDYVQILSDTNLTIQNAFTKGYRNIAAYGASGASLTYITLYKFDGEQYQQKGCYIRTYPESGRTVTTPRKCD